MFLGVVDTVLHPSRPHTQIGTHHRKTTHDYHRTTRPSPPFIGTSQSLHIFPFKYPPVHWLVVLHKLLIPAHGLSSCETFVLDPTRMEWVDYKVVCTLHRLGIAGHFHDNTKSVLYNGHKCWSTFLGRSSLVPPSCGCACACVRACRGAEATVRLAVVPSLHVRL